ncbi:zf-ZPR1-domain-containing protein [Acaromyces ingoldii]|uniref:Zf-ZPR1-domain-containing protein n=1 Tax=Acaromyces ingoldii TaxID=215250 RepID=A0A316YNF0_9BASI|nr:zf-ZPR1-domain-containing protein [Acaromyces ingoldii]PWN89275.1 zf-ZPR1-domain-containing protein [Acaromyces ingoldii]
MVEEIESLCLECQKMGTTRFLLTYIPYFREVIVVSFYCDHCGNRNNEIQSAGQIQEKGCTYTVHLTNVEDLNRQIVKSEHCEIQFKELELTIPKKRGQLTTVEGILSDTLRDLEMEQPLRKHMAPEAYAKIEALCARIRNVIGVTNETGEGGEGGEQAQIASSLTSQGPLESSRGVVANKNDSKRTFAALTMKLDDPSGNSFVEFMGSIEGRGMSDNKWSKRDYARTKEQNLELGLGLQQEEEQQQQQQQQEQLRQRQQAKIESEGLQRGAKRARGEDGAALLMSSQNEAQEEALGGGFSKEGGETEHDNEEVYSFPGTCSSCSSPLETLMKKVNIPYFKDILIMSTNCDSCGYRDNEVKSGSAISKLGRRLTLRIDDAEDLSRDILKSESAGLEIPEIDLHLAPGTLGGRFTTLEGLLQQVYDELSERVLMRGDSSQHASNFEGFLGKLKSAMNAEICPFTLILDDPLSDSYIQNPYAPEMDEQIVEEEYERSWEQNEDLGLNDIKVEDYSEESRAWRQEAEARAGATADHAEMTADKANGEYDRRKAEMDVDN